MKHKCSIWDTKWSCAIKVAIFSFLFVWFLAFWSIFGFGVYFLLGGR